MFFIKKKTDSFKHNMKFLTSIDKYQIDIKGYFYNKLYILESCLQSLYNVHKLQLPKFRMDFVFNL